MAVGGTSAAALTGMLESLFAPFFFVLILAVVVGVAYYRRKTRDAGEAGRGPGEITREEWEERRRKTG